MDLACVYIPHFAAWALAHRWTETGHADGKTGQPPAIAACAHGRVIACTAPLQRVLSLGDPVDRARRLAPDARFLLRDPAVERALWDHVLFRLYDLTPQVAPVPDPLTPASSVRSGRRRPSGCLYEAPATGLWDNGAWALLQGPDHDGLQRFANDTGACVGASSARSWALLAAAYADPGSVTTVPEPMIAAFLRQAPVDLLATLRFEAELIERLRLFGMRAVHHAIHLTRRQWQAQFGSEGVRLFELLHPDRAEPSVAAFDPCVLQVWHEFDWPVFEPAELQPVLHHLLAQLIAQLDGRSARHLSITLAGRAGARRSSERILKEPTSRFDVLRNVADTLLHLALTTDTGGRSVQRLSITCSGLTEVPSRQAGLFDSPRTDSLPGLVRTIEARFPGKLTRPVRAHADPFFPEEEYRFQPVA